MLCFSFHFGKYLTGFTDNVDMSCHCHCLNEWTSVFKLCLFYTSTTPENQNSWFCMKHLCGNCHENRNFRFYFHEILVGKICALFLFVSFFFLKKRVLLLSVTICTYVAMYVFMSSCLQVIVLYLNHWRQQITFSWCNCTNHSERYEMLVIILYTWVRASWIGFNNFPTRCDLFSLLHFYRQLYMFWVLTPIIRSSYNCKYSFWYWLTGSSTIRSHWVGIDSCVSYSRYHMLHMNQFQLNNESRW